MFGKVILLIVKMVQFLLFCNFKFYSAILRRSEQLIQQSVIFLHVMVVFFTISQNFIILV